MTLILDVKIGPTRHHQLQHSRSNNSDQTKIDNNLGSTKTVDSSQNNNKNKTLTTTGNIGLVV